MDHKADPNDPAVLPFHRRLETTAFFYIDAASRLEDDHRFEAFYMYAHYYTSAAGWIGARWMRTNSHFQPCRSSFPLHSFARRSEGDVTTYTTVGYSTVALFFHYPDKERRRIAYADTRSCPRWMDEWLIYPRHASCGCGPTANSWYSRRINKRAMAVGAISMDLKRFS